MEVKRLTIQTTEKKFFLELLRLLQPMTGIKGRPLKVFAELLYEAYLRKHIVDTKDRFKLVFDYDTGIKIQNSLNISSTAYRCALTQLRKLGAIKEGNTIPSYFLQDPTQNISIQFDFVLKREES